MRDARRLPSRPPCAFPRAAPQSLESKRKLPDFLHLNKGRVTSKSVNVNQSEVLSNLGFHTLAARTDGAPMLTKAPFGTERSATE